MSASWLPRLDDNPPLQNTIRSALRTWRGGARDSSVVRPASTAPALPERASALSAFEGEVGLVQKRRRILEEARAREPR